MYDGRNANIVVESLARLREKEPDAGNVRIMLLGGIGNGSRVCSDLYTRAEEGGWLDLHLKPVAKQEAQRAMEESDFLLLVQPQSANQVPGKLFEYICVGRPILALTPRRSAIEAVLAKSGIPHVFIYADDDQATADRKLLEFIRLPSNPVPFSAWFETELDARKQAAHLGAIIDDVAAPPDSRG